LRELFTSATRDAKTMADPKALVFQHKAGNTLASAVAGGGILLFLMVIVFVLQEPNDFQRHVLRFFVSLCAALFAHFFLGGIVLQGSLAGSKIGAGGGFVLFLLLQFVFDPFAAQTAIADIVPSIVPKNPEIAQAQSILKKAGLFEAPASGIPDSQTREAIVKFQQRHNIRADGFLDKETLKALNAAEKQTSIFEGEDIQASDEQKATVEALKREHGLVSPTATEVIFDTLVHLGPDKVWALADQTTNAVGNPPVRTSEKKWLAAFLEARREVTRKAFPRFYESINKSRLIPLINKVEALRD
jgi:hypothetical protein